MASDGEPAGRFEQVAVAAAERMTFFSDAVVAIAMTLLAIDLPVPVGDTPAELLESLGDNSYEYLAFLISFLVIANHWTIHHRVFRWVDRVEGPVVRLNLFWLLLVVINPFLTKVLTDGESNVLRFGMYAIAQSLMMFAFAAMIAILARRHWFAPDAPADLTSHGYLRSLISAVAFLVSVPAYLAIGQWAFVIWALGPLAGSLWLRNGQQVSDG